MVLAGVVPTQLYVDFVDDEACVVEKAWPDGLPFLGVPVVNFEGVRETVGWFLVLCIRFKDA